MVLEEILKPETAEKKPQDMFLIGVLYTTIAVFLSLWIFKDQSSMISVLLIVMASIPIIHAAIKREEKKDLKIKEKIGILKSNSKLLKKLTYFFLGCVTAYTLWFTILPPEIIGHIFKTQIQTIQAINSQVTGGAISSGILLSIISNNLKVLFFCILFSFFYGAGAIFILTWNASVISAAIGGFIRNNLGLYAEHIGLAKAAGYLHIISLGLLKYLTHGIFEIIAYFIGGIAGGLISVAIIKHGMQSPQFRKILRSSLFLLIIAIIVTIGAGLIEVYITPIIT